MGNWEKQQEELKTKKEKDKNRKDKLAGYFFDLSKLSFAGLVIGSIVAVDMENTELYLHLGRAVFGCIATISFARFGNLILK